MFRIRSEHVSSLARSREASADLGLVSYARQRFPSEFLGQEDSQLLKFVQGVRGEARKFLIEREDCVATFLDLTVMYGSAFSEAPWARDVLSSSALLGSDKISLLRHRVEQTGVIL